MYHSNSHQSFNVLNCFMISHFLKISYCFIYFIFIFKNIDPLVNIGSLLHTTDTHVKARAILHILLLIHSWGNLECVFCLVKVWEQLFNPSPKKILIMFILTTLHFLSPFICYELYQFSKTAIKKVHKLGETL